MGFTTTPVAGQATQTQPTTAAESARAKAIAMLTGNQAQQTPVQNPSNISAEEMQGQNSQQKQEEKVTQADPNEAVTQPDKEEPLSTQYAVLARKEKGLRAKTLQMEQSFKQREQALAQREAEIAKASSSSPTIDPTKYVSIEELKRNTFGVMQKNGITYDAISTQAINAESPEFQEISRVAQELREEVRQLREEAGSTRKSFEEQQTQAYQQAVRQIKTEATQLVKANPDFEMIELTDSVDDVVELIERTYKETNELYTVEQAAALIEEQLLEEADKIGRAKKFQARLAKATNPALTQKQSTQAAPQMKTLTNDVQSTRPLTNRERAILAANNGKI